MLFQVHDDLDNGKLILMLMICLSWQRSVGITNWLLLWSSFCCLKTFEQVVRKTCESIPRVLAFIFLREYVFRCFTQRSKKSIGIGLWWIQCQDLAILCDCDLERWGIIFQKTVLAWGNEDKWDSTWPGSGRTLVVAMFVPSMDKCTCVNIRKCSQSRPSVPSDFISQF